MFKTSSRKTSLTQFITSSVITGSPLFFKIHIIRPREASLSYTKYFAINSKLEVMVYLVADDGLKYSYRHNTLIFKHHVNFNTVTSNYNSFFKNGKVEVITIDEYKKKMPEKLDLTPYLQ